MRAFALYRRIMRFTMSDNTSFSQTLARLLQALDAASDAELARALGITPQSVSGARKRGEVPPAWIQACAAQTGVNAHWLFFGSGPMRLPEAAEGELPSIQEDCETELITIPLAEARLSAGTGSMEVSADTEGGYAFRGDFLRRKGNPRRMVLMRVSGDSMVPEIFDNDLVLLDRARPKSVRAVFMPWALRTPSTSSASTNCRARSSCTASIRPIRR